MFDHCVPTPITAADLEHLDVNGNGTPSIMVSMPRDDDHCVIEDGIAMFKSTCIDDARRMLVNYTATGKPIYVYR